MKEERLKAKSKKWTTEEDNNLRLWYGVLSNKEIAEKLNRTIKAIQHRISLLELNKDKKVTRKKWTVENDEYLENWWGVKSKKAIAKALGRTEKSVEHRVDILGLGGAYDGRTVLVQSDIAELLGVDKSTVSNWIIKYELKFYKRNLLNSSKQRKLIQHKDLSQWLFKNQQRWRAEKIPEVYRLQVILDCFGEQWFKDKLKEDSKKLPKRSASFTEREVAELIRLYKAGLTNKEIAVKLKRKYDGVRKEIRKLHKKGILEYRNPNTKLKKELEKLSNSFFNLVHLLFYSNAKRVRKVSAWHLVVTEKFLKESLKV